MNILFNKQFFVGFMVYEVHRVSDGHCPYSVTFSHIYIY